MMHNEFSIDIARSPEDIFAYVTTVANWAGLHPGSQKIEGEGTTSVVKEGLEFVEKIKNAYVEFPATWVISKVVPGKFFQFKFASQFDSPQFNDITITYTLSETATGTHFTRSMVSFLKPGQNPEQLKSFGGQYPEAVHHLKYLQGIKQKLESPVNGQ